MRTILISLDEKHFSAVNDGRKKHEFRRKFPLIEENFRLVFYISSPVQAIRGFAICDPVIYDSIDKMINIVKTHSYSSPERIRTYLDGLDKGYAIPLKSIKILSDELSLAYLRKNIHGFTPPQSYIYLDNSKYVKILEAIDNES